MNILENDKEFLKLTQTIWDFLCPDENIDSLEIDAIFVFGGIGEEIPMHASKLYKQGVSKNILVTGNSGKFTKDVFKEPEALVFKKIMIAQGVKDSDIIVDLEATNAGENVTFGYQILKQKTEKVEHLVLVCRSFMTKRALATFKKQYPNVKCYPSPPKVNLIDIINRSRFASAKRLIAELERLEKYYDLGFISKVSIPRSVQKAKKELTKILEDIEES